MSNPNAFIAHEEDETQAYGVRVSGFDLLGVCLPPVGALGHGTDH